MCFSATASFSAGIVLTVIGIATIKKVQNPSQTLFASIPLIFAAQQIVEGFLWLNLPNSDNLGLNQGLIYAFLFVAQVLWPIWVPLSIYQLTPKADRKSIQKILIAIGILTGTATAIFLIFFESTAKIYGNHVLYNQTYPDAIRYIGVTLYLAATILPLYFSSVKNLWMLGLGILIAYVVSFIFFSRYLLSVWCFFAAIISVTVYVIIAKANGEKNELELKID
jgi:hypothetical protein